MELWGEDLFLKGINLIHVSKSASLSKGLTSKYDQVDKG